jgi:hypothetical protein
MTVCVDADHAHDLVTRRSITEILVILNNIPIRWTIATRIMRFAYIKSEENVSDVLTKPLSYDSYNYLMKRWLFHVPEKDKKVSL